MNKIDVSAIQPNPSKFFTTDHQQENLTKHSSKEDQLEYSIKPLQQYSQSFLVDHHSNSRKHGIFKEYGRLQTVKSEDSISTVKQRIQFKIPAVEDYYIKQCKENINPNKVHRMESMIYTQQREERPTETLNIPLSGKNKVEKVRKRRWIYVIGIFFACLVLLLLAVLTSDAFSSFSESIPKSWKLI